MTASSLPLQVVSPGARLLHPAVPVALAVLVVNDHWLKRAHPGVVSGKLSDLAAGLLLPLVVQAAAELCVPWLTRRPLSLRGSNRALLLGAVVTLLILALPEVWGVADTAYRVAGGAVLHPFRAASALLRGLSVPPFRLAGATPDVTDLVALPMVPLSYLLGRRSAPPLTHCGAP